VSRSYNAVTCGECSLCCKLMGVSSINKPVNRWCRHCTKPGCGIYHDRPRDCQDYACIWLQSHEGEGLSHIEPMALELKPSVCGGILDVTKDGESLLVHMNVGVDYRKGELGQFIKRFSMIPRRVIIVEGVHRKVLWENTVLAEWNAADDDRQEFLLPQQVTPA